MTFTTITIISSFWSRKLMRVSIDSCGKKKAKEFLFSAKLLVSLRNLGNTDWEVNSLFEDVSHANSAGLVLKIKGSIWHIQKGHTTFVTKLALILQKWWELKVLVTISLNKLSTCTHLYDILLFLWFPIPSRFWETQAMVEGEI